MRGRDLSGVVAIAVLSVMLAACTVSPPIPDARTPRPASTTTAVPTPSLTGANGPVIDRGPCKGAVPPYPVSDRTAVEQLGGATLAVFLDRGPMPHAEGEAILNDEGVPIAYRVAENDVLSTVGARFCVGEQWLRWVNHVRRDGDTLYVGDTLNLDAHTIHSVGDQNGVVHSNPLPEGFVIPPQR